MPNFNNSVRRDSDIFGGPIQTAQYNPGRMDPAASSVKGGVFGGSADFLDRLAQAEARDSHRGQQKPPSDRGPITEANWAQRSKKIGQLHVQNEAHDMAARQRAQRESMSPPQQQQMMRQQRETMQRGQMYQQEQEQAAYEQQQRAAMMRQQQAMQQQQQQAAYAQQQRAAMMRQQQQMQMQQQRAMQQAQQQQQGQPQYVGAFAGMGQQQQPMRGPTQGDGLMNQKAARQNNRRPPSPRPVAQPMTNAQIAQKNQQTSFALGSDAWDAGAATPRGHSRNPNGTRLRNKSSSPRPGTAPTGYGGGYSGRGAAGGENVAAGGYVRQQEKSERPNTAGHRQSAGGNSSIALGSSVWDESAQTPRGNKKKGGPSPRGRAMPQAQPMQMQQQQQRYGSPARMATGGRTPGEAAGGYGGRMPQGNPLMGQHNPHLISGITF